MASKVSLTIRFAAVAPLLFGLSVAGFSPAKSLAQSATSFQSATIGTVLTAVMPETAHVVWWVLPAEPSWFANGYTGNLLVIEQNWSIAPGTSVDADCNVAPPPGEVAELMPLEQVPGELTPRGFFGGAGTRTISLAAKFHSGGKPQTNLRALLLAHTDPLTDPILVRIRLIAF